MIRLYSLIHRLRFHHRYVHSNAFDGCWTCQVIDFKSPARLPRKEPFDE